MRHLILHNSENRMFKKDATGAFIPESDALFKYLSGRDDCGFMAKRRLTKGTKKTKKNRVNTILEEFSGADFDTLWFLCHGYSKGIEHGFSGKKGAADLVDSVLEHHPNARQINFYSCLVAKGEDNFCKWVHKELRKKNVGDNVVVFGHSTRGHTTFNPNIKIYEGYKPCPIVYPRGTKDARKDFVSKIQDPKSNYRFSLPLPYATGDETSIKEGKIND